MTALSNGRVSVYTDKPEDKHTVCTHTYNTQPWNPLAVVIIGSNRKIYHNIIMFNITSVLHTHRYRYVQVRTGTYRYVQVRTGTHRYVQVHTGTYRYVQVRTGVHVHIHTLQGPHCLHAQKSTNQPKKTVVADH